MLIRLLFINTAKIRTNGNAYTKSYFSQKKSGNNSSNQQFRFTYLFILYLKVASLTQKEERIATSKPGIEITSYFHFILYHNHSRLHLFQKVTRYLISVVNNNPSVESSSSFHDVAFRCIFQNILMRKIMHFPSPGQMHTDVLIWRGIIAN